MAEILTHVLVGYVLASLLSWRYEWLTAEYVTLAMIGAALPDLSRLGLLVSGAWIESTLGVPYSWWALHTGGGTLVLVLLGGLAVDPAERRRALGLLGLGAASHHVLDSLLVNLSGRSYAVFWPLVRDHPPTPGLYLSLQPEPAIVAGAIAMVVWLATRRRRDATEETVNR